MEEVEVENAVAEEEVEVKGKVEEAELIQGQNLIKWEEGRVGLKRRRRQKVDKGVGKYVG